MKGLKDIKSGRFVKNIATEKQCLFCHNPFSPRHNNQKFCSHECSAKINKKEHTRNCVQCNEPFTSVTMKTRFCSHKCYGESLIKEKVKKVLKIKTQKKCLKVCEHCSTGFYVILSRINRARFCSKNCHGKYYNGEKSCHYKTDRTKLAKHQIRNDAAYQDWRKQIIKRDGYKCRMTNSDCNGDLQIHHILPWRDYENLRYEVNNGICLCKFHHPRKRAEEIRLSPYFQEIINNKILL